jgi:hypothetical protein
VTQEEKDEGEAGHLREISEDIKIPCLMVYFHLRRMLTRDTALCYGTDSAIAQFEKKMEEMGRRYFLDNVPKLAGEHKVKSKGRQVRKTELRHYIETPLERSAAGRVKFVLNMNYLLKWASLPELTEKELI